MTPLYLSILLHYYAMADDFPQVKANETKNAHAHYLTKAGLLYHPMQGNEFGITTYGKKVVFNILDDLSDLLNDG